MPTAIRPILHSALRVMAFPCVHTSNALRSLRSPPHHFLLTRFCIPSLQPTTQVRTRSNTRARPHAHTHTHTTDHSSRVPNHDQTSRTRSPPTHPHHSLRCESAASNHQRTSSHTSNPKSTTVPVHHKSRLRSQLQSRCKTCARQPSDPHRDAHKMSWTITTKCYRSSFHTPHVARAPTLPQTSKRLR